MSDIVHEGMNNFRIVKVELGDDKDWKDRYQVKAFPDFGVFVNGEYHPYSGQKEAGYINYVAIIIVIFSSLPSSILKRVFYALLTRLL